jgi:site-specific DNA-methyltransferase (adenine-specific)
MRVLKPGGYMLAFGGSRMYHRLASGVENAGFEIRDQIMWIYGSGFPKSMDISKQIDKREGAEREVIGKTNGSGMTKSNVEQGAQKRNVTEWNVYSNNPVSNSAKEWEGWGTALKPAHEPIVMARKPLSEKTVVDNVLEWGTGGINIDGCRVEGKPRTSHKDGNKVGNYQSEKKYGQIADGAVCDGAEGRFPANIIFDEEAGKMLPDAGQGGYGEETTSSASRFFYCPKTSKTDRNEGLEHLEDKLTQGMRANAGPALVGDDESGRTTAKNNHPTVKPTDLMLYLIRMVTPKGGTTLDPFMGSGSTGKAAIRGGFDFVGIEREEEYMEIATARIQYEIDNPYNEEKEERIELNKNSQKFW